MVSLHHNWFLIFVAVVFFMLLGIVLHYLYKPKNSYRKIECNNLCTKLFPGDTRMTYYTACLNDCKDMNSMKQSERSKYCNDRTCESGYKCACLTMKHIMDPKHECYNGVKGWAACQDDICKRGNCIDEYS